MKTDKNITKAIKELDVWLESLDLNSDFYLWGVMFKKHLIETLKIQEKTLYSKQIATLKHMVIDGGHLMLNLLTEF